MECASPLAIWILRRNRARLGIREQRNIVQAHLQSVEHGYWSLLFRMQVMCLNRKFVRARVPM